LCPIFTQQRETRVAELKYTKCVGVKFNKVKALNKQMKGVPYMSKLLTALVCFKGERFI
jgi:hypothetical protein